MYKKIHRRIAKNLLVGGMVLSILVGVTIAFIELERVDDQVMGLAIDESNAIKSYYRRYYFSQSDANLVALKKAVTKNLERKTFIFMEIYGKDKIKIFEKSLENIKDVEDELENKRHDFPLTKEVDYVKTLYNGKLYLKIVTPFFSVGHDEIIGYFEGIYRVSATQTNEIKLRVILSMAQSIVVVMLTSILLIPIIVLLNKNLIARSQELLEANIQTLSTLGKTIAKRDSDTNEHNYRVAIYAIRIGTKIGLTPEQMRALIKGAFLHDVGKIGISDNILLKPGRLTEEEFETMKKHVTYGVDIIENNTWLKDANDIVQYHHEKYDGTGYMKGLKGNDIPLSARIFAVADVFDALTSKRPYKEPFSLEKTLAIMSDGAGTHFDENILAIFDKIAKGLYVEIRILDTEKDLNAILMPYIHQYFHI